MRFETRCYLILPLIPGPKIVVEGRILYVHKWFWREPREIPLDGLERDPKYGGFIRSLINLLTGCGNLQLKGSPVGGREIIYNVKNLKGLMLATSPIPSAENIAAEQGSAKYKQGPKGVQVSYETSSAKLKIAQKKRKADFGTCPDVSAMFEDTKIETPFGTFIFYHDGTVSDMENKLMWIQAPWGMEWNGKKFKGEPIELNWNDATKLFGYGGILPKYQGNLTSEDLGKYSYKEYKRGKCVVTFSGYSDWRLPTATELYTLCFPDSDKFHFIDTHTKERRQLRERLFPGFGSFPGNWSANDKGKFSEFAWVFNGWDESKDKKFAVSFVRNI